MIRLYSYWRSSSVYRVRIALNLKGLDYETISVSLAEGEQHRSAYREINPQGLVPFFTDGRVATGQSLAILEYLEEAYPEPPLLPATPEQRAAAREIAQLIACDIQPLCNLRVLQFLEDPLGLHGAAVSEWYRHWVGDGLRAVEARLAQLRSETVCVGSAPSLADACLIPQVYNARRFDVPLDAYPRIRSIAAYCRALPAFRAAAPEEQPR